MLHTEEMPWAWQEDDEGYRSRFRTKGAGKDRPKGGGKGKGSGKGGERRPEWRCKCGVPNFMERNWCRRCGLDFTHGEPIGVVDKVTSLCSPATPVQGANAAAAETATEVVITPLAQQIKFHKALLAAARQHGESPEVKAEILRQEEELKRLATAERESQEPKVRLRSLLDRVRHREEVVTARQTEVRTLTEQLKSTTDAASQAEVALNEAKVELNALQESMAAARTTPVQVHVPAGAGANAQLQSLLAAAKACMADPASGQVGLAQAVRDAEHAQQQQQQDLMAALSARDAGVRAEGDSVVYDREAQEKLSAAQVAAAASLQQALQPVASSAGVPASQDHPPTQEGDDVAMGDDELEDIMTELPPDKKARLRREWQRWAMPGCADNIHGGAPTPALGTPAPGGAAPVLEPPTKHKGGAASRLSKPY